jgi:Tfp pilus assembly protein PilE
VTKSPAGRPASRKPRVTRTPRETQIAAVNFNFVMTGLAKKTTIVIALTFLISALVIVSLSGFLVYQHNQATRAGNEAATIQNLKSIAAVEIQYYNTHNRTFGTFDQLVKEQMLTKKFAASPVIDGYVLTLTVTPPSKNTASTYTVRAEPQEDGIRHFYVDSTDDSIHVNHDKPAGPGDPPLD